MTDFHVHIGQFNEAYFDATDFPITHYYGEKSFGKRLALGEQYKADCKKYFSHNIMV